MLFFPWLSFMLCSKAMGSLTGTVIGKGKYCNFYGIIALLYPILMIPLSYGFYSIINNEKPEQLIEFTQGMEDRG